VIAYIAFAVSALSLVADICAWVYTTKLIRRARARELELEKRCHECNGRGSYAAGSLGAHGTGVVVCHVCGGSGRDEGPRHQPTVIPWGPGK